MPRKNGFTKYRLEVKTEAGWGGVLMGITRAKGRGAFA